MMQDIFRFEKQGRDKDDNVLGTFKATGIRPQCMEALQAAGIELPVGTFTNAQVVA